MCICVCEHVEGEAIFYLLLSVGLCYLKLVCCWLFVVFSLLSSVYTVVGCGIHNAHLMERLSKPLEFFLEYNMYGKRFRMGFSISISKEIVIFFAN